MRLRTLSLALLLAACASPDPLYTTCTNADQCGSRADGDILLDCVDVVVQVDVDRRTEGAFCSIACGSSAICTSRVGLPNGRCILFDGDADAYCYQPCGEGLPDCYPSSVCESVIIDDETVELCLPDRAL